MIDEMELLKHLEDDIEKHKDSDDIIDKAMIVGLRLAINEVLICACKEALK